MEATFSSYPAYCTWSLGQHVGCPWAGGLPGPGVQADLDGQGPVHGLWGWSVQWGADWQLLYNLKGGGHLRVRGDSGRGLSNPMAQLMG